MIATILDSEAAFILARTAPAFLKPAMRHPLIIKGGTVDLRIDYLRPGKAVNLWLRHNSRAGKESGVSANGLRNS